VIGIGGSDPFEVYVVDEFDETTPRVEQIKTAARLLIGSDVNSLGLTKRPRTSHDAIWGDAESTDARRRLADDAELFLGGLATAIEGKVGNTIRPLPSGSATYASPHDGVSSLIQRVALFDRVYVQVPFTGDDFEAWAGSSLKEFLDALPTGRIIPVFAHNAERYEPGAR
jgi:hypothetical protein